MRRRLDIAASIIVTPDLLFLDEPTTGLDPRSRNHVWEIVRAHRRRRHDGAAHHPVPRRGRPARRPDRGDRPRPGDRRGHPRRAEGIRRRAAASGSGCSTPPSGTSAARPARRPARRRRSTPSPTRPASPPGSRRSTARRGRASASRTRSAELTRAGIGVSDFALGQPSLDEVFLALTGSRAEAGTARHGGTIGMSAAPIDRDLLRSRAPGARPAPLAASLAFALALAAEDQARARAARRRHRHPDAVHADVHLPVRRRAGRIDRATTCSSCCPARSRWPSSSSPSTAASPSTATSRPARSTGSARMPVWRPAPIVGGLIGDAGRYLLAAASSSASG